MICLLYLSGTHLAYLSQLSPAWTTLEHWLAAWSTVASLAKQLQGRWEGAILTEHWTHSSLDDRSKEGKTGWSNHWTTAFQKKWSQHVECTKVRFFSTWMLSTNPADRLTLNPPLPSIVALFIPLFQGSNRLLEPAIERFANRGLSWLQYNHRRITKTPDLASVV